MEKEPTSGSIERTDPGPTAPNVVDAPGSVRDAERDVDTAFLATGSPRAVIEAASAAARQGDGALALVLETEGSTYAGAGAMALFAGEAQVGWLSGGCLEPELARRAAQAAARGGIDWIEIDTRGDEDLLSGSALGCRGRLRIALLPLRAMPGADAVFDAWLQGGVALQRRIAADGSVALQAGPLCRAWRLPTAAIEWPTPRPEWQLPLPRLPRLLLLGAGPETPSLLRLLRELGWWTCIAERRPRWRDVGGLADTHLQATPAAAVRTAVDADAVLVMHHDFELDREALAALADTGFDFIGLLGPPRRRDDLFKLLAPAERTSLDARLRSPVGLDLGGRGPEAIALSIAAQLQDWRARAGVA